MCQCLLRFISSETDIMMLVLKIRTKEIRPSSKGHIHPPLVS
jgi:hypothetical protein